MHIPSVETVGGYSITSPPHLLRERGVFTLAIQGSTHPPTLWMTTQCREGDTLSVRVGGDFVYNPTHSESRDTPLKSHDLCLIAGGIGINPLMSILLHHTQCVELGQISGRVKLLFSARNVSELLFKVCSVAAEREIVLWVFNRRISTDFVADIPHGSWLTTLSHARLCQPVTMRTWVRLSMLYCVANNLAEKKIVP